MKSRGLELRGDLRLLVFQYLSVLRPFSKMRPQETELVGWLVIYYLENAEYFGREDDLWRHVFSPEVKREIMEKMGIKQHTLHNLLTQIRKRGVIKDNRVQENYIPRFVDGRFMMVFDFELV